MAPWLWILFLTRLLLISLFHNFKQKLKYDTTEMKVILSCCDSITVRFTTL